MKILIIGYGKMGSFFADIWAKEHTVALLSQTPIPNPNRFKILSKPSDITALKPDLILNAVPLTQTVPVFQEILPFITSDCLLADITSIKKEVASFYQQIPNPFVSTHPMFGPTFGDFNRLQHQKAIIINQSCPTGKTFFEHTYQKLGLDIFYDDFATHDIEMSYALTLPYLSALTFAGAFTNTSVPGTTHQRVTNIATGLLGENANLLTPVLLQKETLNRITEMQQFLNQLKAVITLQEPARLNDFLAETKRAFYAKINKAK